jgi:hypothetical protein
MLIDMEMGLELWQKKPISGDSHKKCMALLTARSSGKLSVEDFEYELAKVAVDTVMELRYIQPPRRPDVLVDFDKAKNDYTWKKESGESKAAMQKKVNDLPEVQKYWQAMDVIWKNQANAIHLEEYLRCFQGRGDKENFKAVWRVYNEFPNILYGHDLDKPIYEKPKF